VGNELVDLDQEETLSREAEGGKKALPELKDSVLGVFLTFADKGDFFGSRLGDGHRLPLLPRAP